MKTYLKVKIASLAAEAKIIRREEHKWKAAPRKGSLAPHPMFFSLNDHRRFHVRPEARAALLAYGFLRGRRYEQIESKCYEAPDWSRVADLITKFGGVEKKAAELQLKAWIEAKAKAA